MIRSGKVILPQSSRVVREFAVHMAADAKRLEEDEETGAKAYRYLRTGPDHFSLAFTYECPRKSQSQDLEKSVQKVTLRTENLDLNGHHGHQIRRCSAKLQ